MLCYKMRSGLAAFRSWGFVGSAALSTPTPLFFSEPSSYTPSPSPMICVHIKVGLEEGDVGVSETPVGSQWCSPGEGW